MYSYPFSEAAPLWNALFQTLLLLFCPLVLSLIGGFFLGPILYFSDNPLSSRHHASAGWLRILLFPFHGFPFIGLLSLLILLIKQLTGMMDGALLFILLTLGGIVHFSMMLKNAMEDVNPQVVDAAKAAGLSQRQIAYRILLPESERRLLHGACETAVFLLAAGAVSGSIIGGGLTGLAFQTSAITPDADIVWFCSLLRAILFVLFKAWASQLAKK